MSYSEDEEFKIDDVEDEDADLDLDSSDPLLDDDLLSDDDDDMESFAGIDGAEY